MDNQNISDNQTEAEVTQNNENEAAQISENEAVQNNENEAAQISDSEALKKKEAPKHFNMKKGQMLFLSFFLPFFICLVVYALGKFYPFGDRQILVTDFWHQYYQIICEFRDKLLSGGSLLYSWHSGLGTNFIALMAYYCASPLNLLTLLVPESGLRIAVSVICFAKIGFCGLTMAACLSYVTKRRDASVVFFSMLYAFCAFIMGYYWNIMWLDSVAVFPLVMLGLYKLIKEKKTLLYTLSLFLCLVFNYYIGFYTCIAAFFAAVFITVVTMDSIKYAVKAFFRTLFHSVIAILMSAVMLLPAFLALGNTYSASSNKMSSVMFNGNILDFLSVLIPYQEPNTKDLVTPNLFCGVISLFLFFIFIFNKKFKLRDKICTSVFLVIIFMSCFIKPLDFIWNGFHYTNMIPYRYSFIFSFILVFTAYRAFCAISEAKLWHILASGVAVAAICTLAFSRGFEASAYASLITLVVYLLFAVLYERGAVTGTLLAYGVCLAVCIEGVYSCAVGISNYSVYSSFLASYDDIQELLSKQEGTDELYRTEVSSYKTLNDPMLYGYNGVSQFASTANYGVSNLLTKLGTGGYCAGNRYTYSQSTPLSMSMLAIRYIIAKEGVISGDTTLEKVAYSGPAAMYEYKYRLPIAFVTHGENETGLSSADVFANQNEFFSNLTQSAGTLYSRCAEPVHYCTNASIEGSGGTYTFKTTTNDKGILNFTFTAQSDGLYYVYAKVPDAGEMYIKYDGSLTATFATKAAQCCILPAGYHKKGETFTVYCYTTASNKSRTANVYAAHMDSEFFESGYEKLKSEQMYDISYTDTRVEGKVNAASDGYLYTSIPYEKGWSLYIDGEKAETLKYDGAFVCARIGEGEHEIVLKYMPYGFLPGIALTLFGALMLAVSCLIYYKKKHGKKAVRN